MSTTSAGLPPPDAPAIYVGAPQGQIGPITLNALLQQVAGGQLPPDAPVWFDGLPNWIKMHEHAELRDRLAALRQGGQPQAPQAMPVPHAPQAPAGPALSDDEQDRIFVDLIKGSWHYYHANQFAEHADEVFLGAVITSTLDAGFVLIDLTSDGSYHYLRFENTQDRTRLYFQLNHLASGPVDSKVLGHQASVVVGFGQPVTNLGRIWGALKQEYKSGYIDKAEPGTITVDADLQSGYIYAQVDMYWNISDYVSEQYAIDYARLTRNVAACAHALRKYLSGRLAG